MMYLYVQVIVTYFSLAPSMALRTKGNLVKDRGHLTRFLFVHSFSLSSKEKYVAISWTLLCIVFDISVAKCLSMYLYVQVIVT